MPNELCRKTIKTFLIIIKFNNIRVECRRQEFNMGGGILYNKLINIIKTFISFPFCKEGLKLYPPLMFV